MFVYSQENLYKIKDPDDVRIIKTLGTTLGGLALFAVLKSGETVQLTSPKRVMAFPDCPFEYLARQVENNFWDDFSFVGNYYAINKSKLKKLGFIDNGEKRIVVYGFYKDGSKVALFNPTKKSFKKKFKAQLETALGLECEDVSKQNIFGLDNEFKI